MIFYNETGEKIDYHLLKRIGGGSIVGYICYQMIVV